MSEGAGAAMMLKAIAMVIAVPLMAYWARAVVDVARHPRSQWEAVAQSRTRWLAVVVLLGPVGAYLYETGPRAAVHRIARHAQTATTFDPTCFGVPDGGLRYEDGGFRPVR